MQNINPNSLGKAPANLPVVARSAHRVATSRPSTQTRESSQESDHRNLLAVVDSLFTQLCGSFMRAMSEHGLDIGPVHIPWRPETSDRDTIERLIKVAEIGVALKMRD